MSAGPPARGRAEDPWTTGPDPHDVRADVRADDVRADAVVPVPRRPPHPPAPATQQWYFHALSSQLRLHLRAGSSTGWSARFHDGAGSVRVGPAAHDVHVEVALPVSSLHARRTRLDRWLRSPGGLDAGQHPVVRFASHGTDVGPGQDGRVFVDGLLTLAGVTDAVRLCATLGAPHVGPGGGLVLPVRLTAAFDPRDFGLVPDPRRWPRPPRTPRDWWRGVRARRHWGGAAELSLVADLRRQPPGPAPATWSRRP